MLSRRIFKEFMALPTWKCLECEKQFKAGEWNCTSGAGHRVATKRYYMNDAPTVPARINGVMTVDKHSATLVMNIPPETKSMDAAGVERITPGGTAQFIRGMYETDDPQKQFWLDKKHGLCNEAEWQAAFLNDQEKMNLREIELAARESRLEARENSLLEKVQAQR